MAKQRGRGSKKRSQNKVLDAFQLAEKASGEKSEAYEDGDLPFQDGVMDARRFLKNQDDLDLDDEELDSDDALGSEDDYDVLNSKFSQTIRDRKGDESEEDEGYSSIDELQLVTLSQAWEMDDKDKLGLGSADIVFDDRASESESESQSESGSESESDSESESESEDEEAMLRGSDTEVELSAVTSAVNAKLTRPSAHRRLVSETTEENEFSVPTRGNKLSLAEMMGEVAEAPHVSQEDKPLAVPLPKRIQQRHDRKVAYEITKEEVSRWQDSVRALGTADHLLFPLAPAVEEDEMDAEAQVDALQLVPEPSGTSELEQKVKLLLEAGSLLDESKEATFEQIAAAKLSKEDMFKRTQELRRMRELMFRDEQRAKRIKKIKSKQYRKIHKKERLRDAELVEGSDESDPEDHDIKRAEERMSLRHKTQSKWAKSMIKSGITKDASTRAELEEMLRAGERLRTKQLGYQEGDQSDDGVSDIEAEYDQDEDDTEERGRLGKGVLAMDFMKAAEERKRKENLAEIEAVRNIDGFAVSDKNSINVLKNDGRRVYLPTVAREKEEMEDLDEDVLQDMRDDDAKSLDVRLAKPAKRERVQEEEEAEFTGFDDEPQTSKRAKSDSFKSSKKSSGPLCNAAAESDDESNPWLIETQSNAKSTKFHTVTDESSRSAKAANKIAKHAKRVKGKSADSNTFIDTDAVLEMGGDVYGSDDDESGTQMFRQQNLIEEAFAGDDVMAEFSAEKQQVVEDEGDKEEDMTLPGWGDWAGSDQPRRSKKKFVRKIDGVAQKDKRKDKGLKNVIVNESVNKKNLKYQSLSVPYPYKLREEYERALRMPLGEEWTSRATHQRATLPRVIVKQGMVVDPLKMPFK